MQINTSGYHLGDEAPCDSHCIFLSVPLFFPAKHLPCATAGVSWGASEQIDGAGRFSCPKTGGYVSAEDCTRSVRCVLVGTADQDSDKIYPDLCKSSQCSLRAGMDTGKQFAINNFS